MKNQVNRIILQIASTFVRGTSASALHKVYGKTFPLVPVEVFGHHYSKATATLEAIEDATKRAERAEKFARTFFNLVQSHQNSMEVNLICGYTTVKVKVSKTEAVETSKVANG
jgi:hypothetical protein